jgi:hypothetical protein
MNVVDQKERLTPDSLGKGYAFPTFPPSRRLRDELKGKSKPGISSYEWMRVWGQVRSDPAPTFAIR